MPAGVLPAGPLDGLLHAALPRAISINTANERAHRERVRYAQVILPSMAAASNSANPPPNPPGPGPYIGVSPWQNVFITIATCFGVFPDNVTEMGAGVQVRN